MVLWQDNYKKHRHHGFALHIKIVRGLTSLHRGTTSGGSSKTTENVVMKIKCQYEVNTFFVKIVLPNCEVQMWRSRSEGTSTNHSLLQLSLSTSCGNRNLRPPGGRRPEFCDRREDEGHGHRKCPSPRKRRNEKYSIAASWHALSFPLSFTDAIPMW